MLRKILLCALLLLLVPVTTAGAVSSPVYIAVTPDHLTMNPGDTAKLKAVLTFSDGKKLDVTRNAVYMISNNKIINVRRGGEVTAVTPGTAAILIRSYGKTAKVIVTVKRIDEEPEPVEEPAQEPADEEPVEQPEEEPIRAPVVEPAPPRPITIPKPVTLTVTPTDIKLYENDTKEIEAILTFSDGTKKDVTKDAVWITENYNVADVRGGKIRALSPGSTKIYVISYGKRAVLTVSVARVFEVPKPVSLEVNPTELTLQPGQSVSIEAKISFNDGSEIDVTKNAVWAVSNSECARVSGGKITALSVGQTQIMLKSYGFTEIINVTVDEPQKPIEEPIEQPIEEEPVEEPVEQPIEEEPVEEPIEQPVNLDREVPAVIYGYGSVSNDFQWQYNGLNYRWHVEAPQELVQSSFIIYELTRSFYESDPYTQQYMLNTMSPEMKELVLASSLQNQGNLTPWANEPQNVQFVKKLAQSLSEQAQADGLDYFQTAEFVLKFVQSMPYREYQYPRLPVQTILESGDCDGRSILLTALLREMGYATALLYFAPSNTATQAAGHMAAAIAISDDQRPQRNYPMVYYNYQGYKFYTAETTNNSDIGNRIGYTITKIYIID